MKTEIGECIPLYWACYTEEYYVRGHVDFEEGKKAIVIEEGEHLNLDTPFYAYGRWSMEINEDCEWQHILRTYSEKGKGRFAITVYPNKGIK
jgi:hypothetical protein